jgi:hypothetical protein
MRIDNVQHTIRYTSQLYVDARLSLYTLIFTTFTVDQIISKFIVNIINVIILLIWRSKLCMQVKLRGYAGAEN